ncbi:MULTISPECIES: aldo/keto reductase [unclassified Clostridium]|uniref:aldo/keto reductase n=1 Tax=unclassified Clostridium TaxID=2614128 RepID=UPI001106B5AA|nr:MULTISPECIES: aldo/keto reductase [unclassified Clostridium]
MRYKKLGNTDLNISVMTVGTWAIGADGWGDVDLKDSIDAIHTALDNGINFIDTAPIYGFGNSEEVVGKAIQGYKDKVMIATKCGIVWGEEKVSRKYAGYDSIIKECDMSLKRLGVDVIDLYQIHWPDVTTPIEESMRALNKLKEVGKIRYIGVSNFSAEQIEEAQQYGEVNSLQPPYCMVNRTAEDLMKWCKQRGIGTLTYGSLGAGILTGAFRELPHFEADDRRLKFYDYFVEPKFSKIMELLKALDAIAADHGKPTAQVALNWSTQNPIVDTALCGIRNPREAKENCDAMDWMLSEDEIKTIDAAYAKIFG